MVAVDFEPSLRTRSPTPSPASRPRGLPVVREVALGAGDDPGVRLVHRVRGGRSGRPGAYSAGIDGRSARRARRPRHRPDRTPGRRSPPGCSGSFGPEVDAEPMPRLACPTPAPQRSSFAPPRAALVKVASAELRVSAGHRSVAAVRESRGPASRPGSWRRAARAPGRSSSSSACFCSGTIGSAEVIESTTSPGGVGIEQAGRLGDVDTGTRLRIVAKKCRSVGRFC